MDELKTNGKTIVFEQQTNNNKNKIKVEKKTEMCVFISIERKLAKEKKSEQRIVVSTDDRAVTHLSNNRRSVLSFLFCEM